MGSLFIDDVIASAIPWADDHYEEGANNWTIFSKILDECKYYDPQYKQNQPWCANFVNCMMLVSALPKDRDDEAKKYDAQYFQYQPSYNNLSCGCRYYAQYFRDAGSWYNRKDAKKGDVIFFGKYGEEEHVGLVIDVDEERIYTVEGNKNNHVEFGNYSKNYTRISGCGRPRYDGESSGSTSKPPENDSQTDYTDIIDKLAHEVLEGKYGNYPRRKQLINGLGYGNIYGYVQKRVNELLYR